MQVPDRLSRVSRRRACDCADECVTTTSGKTSNLCEPYFLMVKACLVLEMCSVWVSGLILLFLVDYGRLGFSLVGTTRFFRCRRVTRRRGRTDGESKEQAVAFRCF